MIKLPVEVKIIDVIYKVEYVDKPSDVDIFKRQTLWGQCDFWTRTIRVYSNDRTDTDIRQTLWHEILHALSEKLRINTENGDLNSQENVIDLLATGINAVLQDNPELK